MLRRKSRSILPKSRSKRPDLRGFQDIKDQMYRGYDLDLLGSCDVIGDVTIRLALCCFYRCSVETDLLSWTVFKILSLIGFRVATLTFQGHVTSTVTWPFDSLHTISYRCYIATILLSPIFQDVKDQMIRSYDLDLSSSRDIIGDVTIRLPLYDFL